MVGVVKDLHKRYYRFISMRDGLHRLRTKNLDLQSQVNNAELRLNEILGEEEKTKLETEMAKRSKEAVENRLEEIREIRENVEKSLKRTNEKLVGKGRKGKEEGKERENSEGEVRGRWEGEE